MWLKTSKEHTDKMSDFELGEMHADLENAFLVVDGIFTKYFVGKEVADNLQDMSTWLAELDSEIKKIAEKREEAKK